MIIKIILKWPLLISFILFTNVSCAANSYKAAITAKELLVLMSACELLPVAKKNAHPTQVLGEMCIEGKRLLKTGMTSTDLDSWVWQPGKMTDHKDYKYAGNAYISDNLPIKKVKNISMDSAHFYGKWPLFFLSAKNSSVGQEKTFFDRAINGLINNLFINVVSNNKEECIVRYKNYIDGTNGVYRWNFQDRGKKFGHNAFALSYTPFFSSLALLDDQRIAEHYNDILSCYPYLKQERKRYFWSKELEKEKLLVLLSTQLPSAIVRDKKPTDIEQKYYTKYIYDSIKPTHKITSNDAYTSVVGQQMLVMYYAFYMNNKSWINDFNSYSFRASNLICLHCRNDFKFYHELHLLYFLSHYISLADQYSGVDQERHKNMFNKVVGRVEDLYLRDQFDAVSNVSWDGLIFNNFKDYVKWKLSQYNN